jgi:hypothetical protein
MAVDTFTEKELDEIYAFAVQLGKDAGKLLLEAAQSRFNGNGQGAQEFEEKDSAVDIVTKTDEGKPTAPCHLDDSPWALTPGQTWKRLSRPPSRNNTPAMRTSSPFPSPSQTGPLF